MTDAATPDDGAPDHDQLIDELTVDEKIDLLHGSVDPSGLATGYVAPNPRVGTPSLSMVDGPMGVRAVSATAFPASIALAAAFDTDLAEEFGRVLAREVRGADQDVLLAPGFNLLRVPQCGRAFEYYSEDPHLNARLAVAAVEGVQDEGVMATAKHYVCNNQEADRHHVSAEVGERALRELYLPAFEAAVKEADVASVMAAYNKINGTYATEHRRLLTDVLKEEWDFPGFVVSDWWATFDGPAAATAGLDVDMPGMPVYEWQEHGTRLLSLIDALPDRLPRRRIAELATRPWQPPNPNPNVLEDSPFDQPLRAAVRAGDVDEALLDEKLRRLFGQMERFGLFAGEQPHGKIDAADHRDVARRIAERGTVLLRNVEGTLPLDEEVDLALVGPDADEPTVGGGGSSEVEPRRTTSPLAGLRDRLAPAGSVAFEPGLPSLGEASMFDGPDFDLPWDDGDDPRIEGAMGVAGDADVAVVVARDLATEGDDRSLALPGAQDELIAAVAAVAERTVVVLQTAGPVEMPWLEDVDAVVEAWYPGQADGAALASVLFGDADPSGRLPVTFGKRAADYPASDPEQYPGVRREAEYSEGVFVGYRGFEEAGVDPLFPFGHGHSYADFEYGDLDVTVEDDAGSGRIDDGDGADLAATVEVTVENVGDRAGREVIQAYLGDRSAAVERPPKELAAVEAIELAAGESATVTLEIDRRAFAYYDEDAGAWTVDPGEFEVLVGRSAGDVRARETIEVK